MQGETEAKTNLHQLDQERKDNSCRIFFPVKPTEASSLIFSFFPGNISSQIFVSWMTCSVVVAVIVVVVSVVVENNTILMSRVFRRKNVIWLKIFVLKFYCPERKKERNSCPLLIQIIFSSGHHLFSLPSSTSSTSSTPSSRFSAGFFMK